MKRFFMVFVVIFCIIFSSCNLIRNQVPADGSRNVTLKNNTVTIDYWLGSNPEADDKDTYQLYIKGDSLTNFKPIFKSILATTHDVTNVQTLTVYTDTIFNEKDVALANTNILGAQVHYLEDTHLKTQVFKNVNNQLNEIQELSSFVDSFSTNDVHDTSKIFNANAYSVFIFVNMNAPNKYETGKSNYDKNLADYKLKH